MTEELRNLPPFERMKAIVAAYIWDEADICSLESTLYRYGIDLNPELERLKENE